jgi:hypothetical protein
VVCIGGGAAAAGATASAMNEASAQPVRDRECGIENLRPAS